MNPNVEHLRRIVEGSGYIVRDHGDSFDVRPCWGAPWLEVRQVDGDLVVRPARGRWSLAPDAVSVSVVWILLLAGTATDAAIVLLAPYGADASMHLVVAAATLGLLTMCLVSIAILEIVSRSCLVSVRVAAASIGGHCGA